MLNHYEKEILKIKEELGVDLLPKYLTPSQQMTLLQAMVKDLKEKEEVDCK